MSSLHAQEITLIDGIEPVEQARVSLNLGTAKLLAISRYGGTGFVWRVATDQPQRIVDIKFIQSRALVPADRAVPGAPQLDIYRVEGRQEGTVQLNFELLRVRGEPARRIKMDFKVNR